MSYYSNQFEAGAVVRREIREHFEFVSRPSLFKKIVDRLTYNPDKTPSHPPYPPVYGFEDQLGASLGSGFWFNTRPTIDQLGGALTLLASEPAAAIINDSRYASGRSVVSKMRDEQILGGRKILDLGSGFLPGFAVAAKTLGAEAYTVDAVDVGPRYRNKLDGHLTLDLTDPSAASTIADNIGGEFDLVSENIIGNAPGTIEMQMPTALQVQSLGQALLKVGGYLDFSYGNIRRKIK